MDAVKGTCMLLIINGHIANFDLLFPLDILDLCKVMLFFVVAGYTYRPSDITCSNYCIKRAKRLLIPYFVYSVSAYICLFPWLIVQNKWATSLFGIFYARFSVTLPHADNVVIMMNMGNGPLWFLPAMFVGSCLFYLLMSQSLRGRLMGAVGCYCIPVAACYIPFLLPWGLEVGALAALCMLAGYGIKGHTDFGNRWGLLCTLLLSFSAAFIMGHLLKTVNVSIAEFGSEQLPPPISLACLLILTIAVTYSLAICFRLLQGAYLTRLLAFFGRISLTLLCTHMYSGHAAMFVLKRLHLPPFVQSFCSMVIMLITAAVLHAVFKRFKERWPLLQYL